MLPDQVSNQGPLTYESGAQPIALCGPAIWTEITPFFICSALLYVKELDKIIARMHCFMHQSFFQTKLHFYNDAYFLDFYPQKFPLIFFNVNPF